jgi:branched-chain amino acid aminotransferase
MRIKSAANYQNSRLALLQAIRDGYDSTILLNHQGKVAEGPGACLFLLRDDQLVTPTVTSDLLESITRDTVVQLYQG